MPWLTNSYRFGGGGAPGGHKYWRLYILGADNGGQIGLAGLAMAATTGGADQCSGGTASASSTAGSNTAANAFDGDNATGWAAESGFTPRWIQYEFASAVTVAEIRIRAWTTGTLVFPNFSPNTFTLLGSNDGSTWTAYAQFTGETGWTSGEQRTYAISSTPLPTTGDQPLWRINVTANDGGGGGLGAAEISMASSHGGSDLTGGGKAFATNWFNSSYVPSNLIDNSTGTEWATLSGSYLTGQIVIKLPTAAVINEVKITSRAGGAASQAPRTFTIEYSYDGVNWTVAHTVASSSGWGGTETRTFSW